MRYCERIVMRKLPIVVFLLNIIPTIAFALSISDLETIDEAKIKDLQINLATLGYSVGKFDGRAGKKTFAGLASFAADEGISLEDSKYLDVLRKLTRSAKIAKRSFAYNHFDDFSAKSLRKYETTTYPPYAGKKPYSFQQYNQNTVLRIQAMNGFNIQNQGVQCDKPCIFDYGSKQARQDKFEIRIQSSKIEGKEIWWGFKVRKAQAFEDSDYGKNNCHTITFAQMKNQPYKLVGLQYAKNTFSIGGQWGNDFWDTGLSALTGYSTKNRKAFLGTQKSVEKAKEKMRSSGWEWTKIIQIDRPSQIPGTLFNPYLTDFDQNRCVYQTMPGFSPVLSGKWNQYKIGVYLSSSNDGWEVYQNNRLMHSYAGRTYHKEKKWINEPNKIALGLYRRYRVGNELEQALEFDNFVATGTEALVDGFLLE